MNDNIIDFKRWSFISMIFLSTIMFITELVVGHATNSIALIADSFHMLFDIISLFIGFISDHLSKSQDTSNVYPYGWSRASTIGGFVNSCFMLSLCVIVFREGFERLIHFKIIQKTSMVLVTSILGLIVNIIAYFVFHSLDAGRLINFNKSKNEEYQYLNDLESNQDTISLSKKSYSFQEIIPKNLDCHDHMSHDHNIKGVIIHIIGDALGSVFVIICTLVIMATKHPLVNFLDPITSILLACIMTFTTFPLFKKTLGILLHQFPTSINKHKFEKIIFNFLLSQQATLDHYNIYTLSNDRIICELYLNECHTQKEKILQQLRPFTEMFPIEEIYIHFK